MRELIVSTLQKKNLVAQSNKIVEGRYTATKNELILLVAMISLIEPKDKEFLTFSVTINELSKILNIDSKSALREFKKISRRLMTKVVEIETQDGWEMFQWVTFSQLKGNLVSLRFHDHLKPYLLDLKRSGNFTQYRLEIIIQFRSSYTIRIYQILREYYSKRMYEFEFSLDYFRNMVLGEKSKKYPVFREFRKYVLNVAQKELSKINEDISTKAVPVYKSDLNFKLVTRRTGRKISHLKFIIQEQNIKPAPKVKPVITIAKESDTTEIPQILIDYEAYGVMRTVAEPYLEARGEQALIKTLERCKKDHKAGKIKDNIGGYLFSLLKSNAGQQTPAEREEEKKKEEKKRKAEEVRKQKLLAEKREEFKNECSSKLRKDFINSLSEEKRETIRQDFINSSDPFFANAILRKNDLFHPAFGAAVIPLIPQYEQQKEEYAIRKLKELGFI